MEHFVYPPYGVYQSYANTFTSNHNVPPKPPSKQKQPSWKQSKSSGTPNPYRGGFSAHSTPPPGASPDYLDTYKRAQLKALLSQVSPGLPPRLHKASTKEVGIQVNPRVDAAVQCSLGSRPLQAVRPQSPSGRLSREPPLLGVYSPIVGRRLCTLPEVVVEPTEQEEAPTSQQPSEEAKGQVLEAVAVTASEEAGSFPDRLFLEQKYGYFHCNGCKTRWESAYVWCISGTNKVYFKQLCRKCQKSFNPYKVESIQCHICSKTRCSCPQKKRHIDLKRPHRQELCGRCRGKRLSCDNTYSFKYIV
uniref:Zygote arrest 1 like n=1 Tax=Varanus komodoensis TaxID=61221 RepID=A0A8D2J9B9_VARKO